MEHSCIWKYQYLRANPNKYIQFEMYVNPEQKNMAGYEDIVHSNYNTNIQELTQISLDNEKAMLQEQKKCSRWLIESQWTLQYKYPIAYPNNYEQWESYVSWT